jgi:Mce-associated membrane protein
MRSPNRGDSALDKERPDTATADTDLTDIADCDVDDDLIQQTEAEASTAEAAAAAARARAAQLRAKVHHRDEATSTSTADAPDDTESDDTDAESSAPRKSLPASDRRRWRPRVRTVVAGAAVAIACALVAACGYMVRYHQQFEQQQQRRAEFSAAATQAVVTLMSIDAGKAHDDVQRVIANSTGAFRDDFQSAADDFVKAAQDSKAVTKASARAAAVESMTQDSAIVLVTAATTVSNAAGADQQPRTWRLSVDMVRDGGQLKMSKVDFVP